MQAALRLLRSKFEFVALRTLRWKPRFTVANAIRRLGLHDIGLPTYIRDGNTLIRSLPPDILHYVKRHSQITIKI